MCTYVCGYVCVYAVYVYMCTCVLVCACGYACMCVHGFTCVCVCMCTWVRACGGGCTCTCVFAHDCLVLGMRLWCVYDVCARVWEYTPVCVHVHVWVCVHVYLYMYVWCVYVSYIWCVLCVLCVRVCESTHLYVYMCMCGCAFMCICTCVYGVCMYHICDVCMCYVCILYVMCVCVLCVRVYTCIHTCACGGVRSCVSVYVHVCMVCVSMLCVYAVCVCWRVQTCMCICSCVDALTCEKLFSKTRYAPIENRWYNANVNANFGYHVLEKSSSYFMWVSMCARVCACVRVLSGTLQLGTDGKPVNPRSLSLIVRSRRFESHEVSYVLRLSHGTRIVFWVLLSRPRPCLS